jgi:hypothetical protein
MNWALVSRRRSMKEVFNCGLLFLESWFCPLKLPCVWNPTSGNLILQGIMQRNNMMYFIKLVCGHVLSKEFS